MPLKIRVKPEAKIYAGGAVLKNVGKRPAELLILSDSPVLRDDYLMNPEKSEESDAAGVYFLLQLVYLFKGKGQPLDSLVVDTLKNFTRLYPDMDENVAEIVALLERGDTFKALRLAHGLLDALHPPSSTPSPAPSNDIVSDDDVPPPCAAER